MPSSCWAPNCNNRLAKGGDVKMFRFPSSNKDRCSRWLARIGRLPPPGETSKRHDGLHEPKEHDRLCSAHFVKGRPSDDPLDVDYIPTIFSHTLKSKKDPVRLKQIVDRKSRVTGRAAKRQRIEAAEAMLSLSQQTELSIGCQTNYVQLSSTGTQTDALDELVAHDNEAIIIDLEAKLLQSQVKIAELQELYDALDRQLSEARNAAAKASSYCSGLLGDSDKRTKYYTGLPNYATFCHVVQSASANVDGISGNKLTAADGIFMTLVKLRHNPGFEDLSYRFNVSLSSVTRTFHYWLELLYKLLKELIVWPTTDAVQLPVVFRNNVFHRVRCIIDCTEIFIERPSRLLARAQTYSNYKHHNTLKFLVGISPSGSVTFLSSIWGGRASDRVITMQSGLLRKLLPGDVVLADRGFTMSDVFALHGIKLVVPAYTKGKKQLSAAEVEKSRQMSRARIHVERVIGRMKDMKILRDNIPISLIKKANAVQETPTVEMIVTVACAVVNMNQPVL